MPLSTSKGRRFTEAARAAAMDARRRKREMAVPGGTPEVFVVRRAVAGLGYGWEIRRFGGVVLETAQTGYATMQGARSAGEAVLWRRAAEA